MKLKIRKFNETYLQLDGDPDILHEISDHFQFEVPGARYHPKVKAGIWSGYIRLFNLNNRLIYCGLLERVIEFCKARKVTPELVDSPAFGLPGQQDNIHLDDVQDYIESLNIHSRGEKIEIRDYQISGVYSALKNKRNTVLASTGSGKSVIQYVISRYITENHGRVLIVVPTIQLVDQMYGDFKDYSTENGWDVEAECHKISGGKEKISKKNIVISTWQSIQKMESGWLNQFTGIIVDEVHTAAAMVLTKLMEKSTDVQYRIGLTGTLSKAKANEMVIVGLFGDITRITNTKKLMEDGHLAGINIKTIVLKYNESKPLFAKKIDYHKELEFLTKHERRNKFIRKLALSLEGNTLILFQLVEGHGDILYKLLMENCGDRQIHYVHGGVAADDREEVRHIVEDSNNSIILASFGTFQAGINIKKLHNIILASPTKSMIRLLQSIGRGLRTHESKTHLNLYDIIDALNVSKTKRNHTYLHGIERLSIYTDQEFEYKIIEVPIEK
jgi:superfamily II DNA or RNA helicase